MSRLLRAPSRFRFWVAPVAVGISLASTLACGSSGSSNPAMTGGAGGGAGSGGSGALPEGSIAFSASSAVTTNAKWGDDDAKLSISHVANLRPFINLTLAPSVDGIPCKTAQMSDADNTVLELGCSIRPGNDQRPKPKLSVKVITYTSSLKEVYVDVPGGTFDVPVKACEATPAPAAGVPLPQLCAVAPGSTADVGNAFEGIFSGMKPGVQGSKGANLIASDGTYVGGLQDLARAGKLVPDGSWTISEGYGFSTTDAVSVSYTQFGHGATSGTFVPYKSNSLMSFGYAAANALAVDLSSVAGTWSTKAGDETSLAIEVSGDSGRISGTRGGSYPCQLSGTIRLREPGSAKNLYDMTVTASSLDPATSSPCEVPADATLKGLAAIDFVNVGTELNPVYAYALDYSVFQIDKFALSGQLYKE